MKKKRVILKIYFQFSAKNVTQACRGNRGIMPLILKHRIRLKLVVQFTPGCFTFGQKTFGILGV